jgi:hypothetical protein
MESDLAGRGGGVNMQIKTAISIGIGIVAGTVIGMCVDEEAKISIINRGKKKLLYLLTRNEWEVKKKPVNFNKVTTYRDFHPSNAGGCLGFPDELLNFDSEDEAKNMLHEMRFYTKNYKTISVYTLSVMRNMVVALNWDNYGWSDEDVRLGAIGKEDGKWRIKIRGAKVLDQGV